MCDINPDAIYLWNNGLFGKFILLLIISFWLYVIKIAIDSCW